MDQKEKSALVVVVVFVIIGVIGVSIFAVVPWNWMHEPLSSSGLTGVGQSWAYVKQGGIDGDMLVGGNLTVRFIGPGICAPAFMSSLWVMTESQFQGWSSSSPMNAPTSSQVTYFSAEVWQHYYNQTGLGGCFPEIDSTWPVNFRADQSTYYFVVNSGGNRNYPATLSVYVHSEPAWSKVLLLAVFGLMIAVPPIVFGTIFGTRKRRRSKARKSQNGSGKKGAGVEQQLLHSTLFLLSVT